MGKKRIILISAALLVIALVGLTFAIQSKSLQSERSPSIQEEVNFWDNVNIK